jgi:hypothetical protein
LLLLFLGSELSLPSDFFESLPVSLLFLFSSLIVSSLLLCLVFVLLIVRLCGGLLLGLFLLSSGNWLGLDLLFGFLFIFAAGLSRLLLRRSLLGRCSLLLAALLRLLLLFLTILVAVLLLHDSSSPPVLAETVELLEFSIVAVLLLLVLLLGRDWLLDLLLLGLRLLNHLRLGLLVRALLVRVTASVLPITLLLKLKDGHASASSLLLNVFNIIGVSAFTMLLLFQLFGVRVLSHFLLTYYIILINKSLLLLIIFWL